MAVESEVYVGVKLVWDVGFKSHIVRADVPAALYAVPNAWDQVEEGPGLWRLKLRKSAVDFLNANPKVVEEMEALGAKWISGGKPTEGAVRAVSLDEKKVLATKLGVAATTIEAVKEP